MTHRTAYGSPCRWEAVAGFAHAVKYGNAVYVSGATAVDESGVVVTDDAGGQAAYAIDKIRRALQQAGATMRDVVRTRVYLTDPDIWQHVAQVHREHFADVLPANTLVIVRSVIAPGCLVEIEADAVIRGN